MRLVLTFLVQTIVWLGFMGAALFAAAGTIDYPGGWLYLAEMVAISLVLGLRLARIDPGLLKERLKPPVQREQTLADKVIIIPILLAFFGAMAFMAADARRWRWSYVSPGGQAIGAVLFLVGVAICYWAMRANSFAAPVVKIQKERGQTVITTGPYRFVRHPLYSGALVYLAGTSLVLGSWWGLATVPLIALLLGVRIDIEEKALSAGLDGYDAYAQRVRWRLVPLVW
jgi:protein-S-isoprenylcysteine O-methyltransferase Ste14